MLALVADHNSDAILDVLILLILINFMFPSWWFCVLTRHSLLMKCNLWENINAGSYSWCLWGYVTSSLAQVPLLCIWFFQKLRGRNLKIKSVGLPLQQENRGAESKSHRKLEGYSFPLCSKIIEILGKSREIFHIQTLHVLGHNTRWDSEGNALPIFHGFLVSFDFMKFVSSFTVWATLLYGHSSLKYGLSWLCPPFSMWNMTYPLFS